MYRGKLSNEAKLEIKDNAGRGKKTYKELAKKYGVHVMTVNFWANESLRERAMKARKEWRENNKEYIKEKNKERNRNLKIEVMSKYANPLQCWCCQEKTLEFLSIDHINGGGGKHRREIGLGKIYHWLKKNDYPSGFRVLCMNCNHAWGHYSCCPHKNNNYNEK